MNLRNLHCTLSLQREFLLLFCDIKKFSSFHAIKKFSCQSRVIFTQENTRGILPAVWQMLSLRFCPSCTLLWPGRRGIPCLARGYPSWPDLGVPLTDLTWPLGESWFGWGVPHPNLAGGTPSWPGLGSILVMAPQVPPGQVRMGYPSARTIVILCKGPTSDLRKNFGLMYPLEKRT